MAATSSSALGSQFPKPKLRMQPTPQTTFYGCAFAFLSFETTPFRPYSEYNQSIPLDCLGEIPYEILHSFHQDILLVKNLR